MFVVMWAALFLMFGFIYFLGTLGVPSKPTQWMLEMGLSGIAKTTALLSFGIAILSFLGTRAEASRAKG